MAELTGTLTLRGQAWYLRKQIAGKRKDHPLKVFGGEANRRQAEKAAKALERQLLDAQAAVGALKKFGLALPTQKDGAPTFAGWWADYEKRYLPKKAERTQTRDKQIIERWLPIMGAMRMDEIRQTDCLGALQQRQKTYAGNHKNRASAENSAQRERDLLQAVFEKAVLNDIITKNPWKGIESKSSESKSDQILSETDEVKLLQVLTEARPAAGPSQMMAMNPRYARFVTFMLQTGLRIDEVLNGFFTDNGDHVRVKGKGSKFREVALTKKARQVLTEQVAADGKVWWQTQARFRAVLKVACERAGIPHISPHDLRHTFGHRYLAKGKGDGDIYVLSKILGHANVAVTEKHYAYLRREDIASKMLAVMDSDAA